MRNYELTPQQYRRHMVLSQVLYWAFIAFLLAPPALLILAGLNWTFGRLEAMLPQSQRSPQEDLQLTLRALAIALPGILLELAAFCAWAWRQEKRQARGGPHADA